MGTPHFAPSAKFQLILQVFPTKKCKGFASKCPGGQIDRLRTDTLIEWRGYSGLKTPLRSTQKFLRRGVDGGGHRLLMRCSRAARSMLRASARSHRCRPSAAATTGSAAFGRAGAFGARWHLHWHAIVSSRAVQSRASARLQALDATCVSRKRHQVHGGRLILRRAQNSN